MNTVPIIYCSKCKRKTLTIDHHYAETSKGHPMIKGHCNVCSTYKSSFLPVKEKKDVVSSAD